MSEPQRWRILFEFTAPEEFAKKVREEMYARGVNTSGFNPHVHLHSYRRTPDCPDCPHTTLNEVLTLGGKIIGYFCPKCGKHYTPEELNGGDSS